MKVTITIDHDGEERTVARAREDVVASEAVAANDVDLDAVLAVAVLDARRACNLPRHELDALTWLVGLPHPESPVLDQWRGEGKLTLGQVVATLAPLIPANSLDAPLPDAPPNVSEAERALARAQYDAQLALNALRGALRRNAAEKGPVPHRLTGWVDITETSEVDDR